MNREFFVNISFLIVINALIKPFFIFGIDRSVQNLVGEQAYGLYFSLLSFTFLLQIINDFGIQNFNSREIARHRHMLGKYVTHILGLKTALAGIYLLVVLPLGFVLYEGAYMDLIFLLAVNQILNSLIFYLRSNIAGLGMYRVDSIISALDRLILIFLAGALIWIAPLRAHFNVKWFVYAQTTSLLLTALTAFVIIYRRLEGFRLRLSWPFALSILRGAMPYALAIFLMIIYTKTDVVMMERMLPDGARQAGIYASAYRLLDAVNMLGFLFAGLLLPMFSRMLKEGKDILPLLRFSFQLIMVGAVTIAAVVWFHRADIMSWLYHEATGYSGDVLGVLMFSFIAVSGTYIYSTLIGAAGLLSKMNRLLLFAFGLNIALNAWLIPQHKALGAACSTFVTQFFVMISLMFLAKKLLILRGDTGWFLKIGGFVVGTFVLVALSKMVILKTQFWLWQAVLGGFCGVLWAFILGFFNYKKVEFLFKNPENG